MKTLITFLVIFVATNAMIFSQVPTDAGIPDANHVLVVYNANSDTSSLIANYYKTVRNIPSINVFADTLPSSIPITIDGETHTVGLAQVTDNIRDFDNHNGGTWYATEHSWKYFYTFVALPIKNWISSHNLENTIRYVCLIKGVPFKVQAGADSSSVLCNVSVDGLLCMLNTDNYEGFLHDLYTEFRSMAISGEEYNYTPILSNPYYDVDKNYTMDYRFLPDHFTTGWEGYTVKLSYLVSHLDGISYDVVKNIIDRSVNPDTSSNRLWVLDGDPDAYDFPEARDNLVALGENVIYDTSDDWVTEAGGPVIGYVSNGIHAEDNNPNWHDSTYWVDLLNFQYANGAIATTYESFNGNSLTTLNWRSGHGLITQFSQLNLAGKGGSGFGSNAWEPYSSEITNPDFYFPYYAVGYNQIDAAYMGTRNLAWVNVFMGDPLTRIYDCESVISTNTTIGSDDYTCDLIVEENATLTISNNSIVNFGRNAKLLVYGTLKLEGGVTLNFDLYSRFYLEGNLTLNGNPAYINFNDNSRFKANNFSVDNSLTITFNDNTKFYINEEGTLATHSGNLFVFNDNSIFYSNGRLIVNEGNSLHFNNSSSITVKNKIYLKPGSELNFYDNSRIYVDATLISQGEPGNNVIFNFSTFTNQFNIIGGDTLLIDFTTINNSGINVQPNQPELITYGSITNSLFESPDDPIIISGKAGTFESPIVISNCNINNCSGIGIGIYQVPEIIVEDNFINISSELGTGINLTNNGIVNIINCEVTGGTYGISSYTANNAEEDTIEYRTGLESDISIRQCEIQSQTGILFDVNTVQSPISTLKIKDNQFSQCHTAIIINRFGSYIPEIKANTITGYQDGSSRNGIVLSNGGEAYVYHNDIFNFLTGINLNIVTIPYILENSISAIDLSVEPLSGIISISSNGQIRNNTIQYHWHGIELGSSSPNIGANTITDNLRYGIYINDHSHPDLSEQIVGGDPYPLSGYNTIKENGVCNFFPSYSELYLRFNSTVNLEKGCNTIADDREDPALHCNYLYLIDGSHVASEVNAVRNYWGEVNHHNPEGRFGGGLIVDYADWQIEPCTYDEGGGILILANSKGEVYDTVYASGETPSELTDIESRYATANEYYYNNNYSQAKQAYEGIIQNYSDSTGSLQAYNRLFTIANLTNSPPAYFNQLKDFYSQKVSSQTDSIMIGTLTHLSDLCLVSAEEYITAINNFDEIAQHNPNTEIALYRQIDALTTALLLTQDSNSLNKGTLGKYSVNNLSDYIDKLSELMKTRGNSGQESEGEILPTECTLYQNYPNPLNPVTTIKYDLSDVSDVSLIIYDILGRKVKELVNTKQQAGRYEIQVDASNFASGVYVYKLQAGDFISSKKMLMIK